MNRNLYELILLRNKELIHEKKKIESLLKNHKEKRSIRINHNRGYIEYYLVTPENFPNGKYIRKKNLSIASSVLQADYYKEILKKINEELHTLSYFISHYPSTSYEDVYSTLCHEKQQLVTPIIDTDEVFLSKWLDEHPEYLNSFKFPNDLFTRNNNPIRSKSEKIIADALISYGIPFRYECEIIYKGQHHYPDFTCLNQRTRQTWIWDHSGLLTKSSYASDFCERAEMYEALGYHWGNGLIVTVESDEKRINTKTVDALIKRYLL